MTRAKFKEALNGCTSEQRTALLYLEKQILESKKVVSIVTKTSPINTNEIKKKMEHIETKLDKNMKLQEQLIGTFKSITELYKETILLSSANRDFNTSLLSMIKTQAKTVNAVRAALDIPPLVDNEDLIKSLKSIGVWNQARERIYKILDNMTNADKALLESMFKE